MAEKPLYEDSQLKITLLTDENGKIISGEDHEIHIDRDYRYALPRGILKEFARTPRDRLETRLEMMYPGISYLLKEHGLTTDSVGVAICQAYSEEERRFEEYLKNKQEDL